MFGTIMIDQNGMAKAVQARYQQCYCGLCHQLDTQFGSVGCATLTYDMTFLSILLGAICDLPETTGMCRCATKPIKQHSYVLSKGTAYAADMNLILSYYQCLDDWHDDGNRLARQKSKLMEKFLPDIHNRWSRQCSVIGSSLAALGEMERSNELNPDLPANCFGRLLGTVFAWQNDEHAELLFKMGAALGRYVYLLDAVNDLKADIKKERYNPVVAQSNSNFKPMLVMMMAECTEAFEAMRPFRDQDIIQNVLYAGVWKKYHRRKDDEEDG